MRRSNRKHSFMKKINMLGAFILSCQVMFSISGSNTDHSFWFMYSKGLFGVRVLRLALFLKVAGLTCRWNTIRLASCISFSSCSWCSSQVFSSSGPSNPREGHSPQRGTSSGRKQHRGEAWESQLFNAGLCASFHARREMMGGRPTWQRFPLHQLGFVIPTFPLVFRLIMDRLQFGGGGRLGDSVLLFGGVCRAGWAEAETDGVHEQESVCLYLLPN